jgi:hypothetical protein
MENIPEIFSKITDKLIKLCRLDAIVFIVVSNKDEAPNNNLKKYSVSPMPTCDFGDSFAEYDFHGFNIVYVYNRLAEGEIILYRYSEFKQLEL